MRQMILKLSLISKNQYKIKEFKNLPCDSSVPKMIAWLLAMVMECTSEVSLKLVLMSGVITPSLESPNHIHINSGLFSKNKATLSPFLYPWLLKTFASLLLYSST